jgi:integrase
MKGLTVRGNKARYFFVSRDMAALVLDACPDAQWRLLFALSRFGGLRCPSENLGLRWGDVDWERNRMTVHSPKTEHHEGGETRVIPIFPEVRTYLEEVYDQAAEGTEYVITRYRDRNSNLRTQLLRIIRKAGVDPWPKLFQNLRATRQTELTGPFPQHVVCKWIGNTAAVATEHYLQVTDEHFERAQNVGLNVGLQSSESAGKAQQPTLTDPGIAEECASVPSIADRKATPGRIRTCDLRFRKPLLYPLSYRRFLS